MIDEVKPITHAELVLALAKPGMDIALDLKASRENKYVLLDEAKKTVEQADRLDRAKKQAIYNKPKGIRAVGVNLAESNLTDVPIGTHKAHLLHMAIGIAGEAGELLDAVLKHILEEQLIDRENVVEELGDIEFFMEGLRHALSISRDETISDNISKLSIRYGSGSYSDNQAQSRADKSGE